MIVTDPFMWSCQDGHHFRATRPFSLDTSTHLTLSSQNDYLFFNCSEERVIVQPKPIFCERFPDRCDSTCDSASYLCRHLPGCSNALGYASIYWRTGVNSPDDQVPEYGIRVDFDIPVTTDCLQCQDMKKGGGSCGFDTQSQSFLCLCNQRSNVTTYCNDHSTTTSHSKAGVIAGTVTGVSAAGVIGIGAGLWYWKKVRATAPVTCGVQSNENRLF
ncbi:hypothetical protein OIU84_014111 [Salix udensis]|uniref:Wall-associated receptor kinase C-terminal domain-containing protein n=1 Tax=Salix udensis TaxID=889485 RepID=A0AAD6NR75_9ROSI|nr:hypothetical protein OIU84_014111 [Salix udensis]